VGPVCKPLNHRIPRLLILLGFPAPELANVAFEHQQELKLLLEEIRKSEMAIQLAEKKYYPDLTPGFSCFEDRKARRVGTVKTSESFEATPDTQPELWFGENDAYIRKARLNYQSLLKNLEDHKEGLRFKVKKFFMNWTKPNVRSDFMKNRSCHLLKKHWRCPFLNTKR